MEENQPWLTKDFLSLVLKESAENEGQNLDDVVIVDYKAKKAIEDGKNYSSVIYKVNVTYEHDKEIKKKSYIVKQLIETVKGWLSYKEEETYKSISKIEERIKDKFAPKLFMNKDDLLVMEDLTEQGFQNSRIKLLDYDHCALAVKNLAKFHAGSVMLHRNDPKHVEEVIGYDAFLNNPSIDFIEMFEKNFRSLGQEISTWPESRRYAEYFPGIALKLRTCLENVRKRKTFKVLNHGDFWLSNMMFKYDNGKVIEHRMVDLQICRFAPPTCDFQYFIGSSSDFETRHNRLDDLINLYLDTFNSVLADIGINQRMTRQEFEDGLKEDYYFYFIGLLALSVNLSDPEDAFTLVDVDFNKEASGLFQRYLKTKGFRQFFPLVLDDINSQGMFDRI